MTCIGSWTLYIFLNLNLLCLCSQIIETIPFRVKREISAKSSSSCDNW